MSCWACIISCSTQGSVQWVPKGSDGWRSVHHLALSQDRDGSCSSQLAFHGFGVFAQSGGAHALGPMSKHPLARLNIVGLPMPRLQRLILQRAPVREAEFPGLWPGELINRIQMHGGGQVILAPG